MTNITITASGDVKPIRYWCACRHVPEEKQFTILLIAPLKEASEFLLDCIKQDPVNVGAYYLKPMEVNHDPRD